MSDVVEGIGGAIEGALAGRAVEPSHGGKNGERNPDAAEGTVCLNCGAHISDNFCAHCGQKTRIHRSLAAIGHDIMHGVLHLDGKLWRTLPLLTFKPGNLTRRYIDGERARFVSPMAMFLFSIFAMFAVFQMVGITTPTEFDFETPAERIRTQGAEQVAILRERLDGMPADDPNRADVEGELAILEGFVAAAQNGQEDTAGAEESEEAVAGTVDSQASNTSGEFNLTGFEALDNGILKKWNDNPGLMLYKLQANAYKFSWLLVPLSVPFVWLMFAWRRKFKAYDHAIFVTYSLAFMSLLFIALSLLSVSPIGSGWVFAIFAVVAPLHIYKHLRYTYGLSRFSTIWRFMALFVFINIILVLFLQVLLVLGGF